MSTSDLYLLNAKSTRHLAEFRNGWGSGPIAWDHLAAKYIAERPAYALSETHLQKVWALAEDARLADHEQVALRMTFDGAYVPTAHLAFAGAACERFGRECEDGQRANHWPAIGAALIDFSKRRFGRHARGVALSCTSVSDPWSWPNKEQLDRAWPILDAPTHNTTQEP